MAYVVILGIILAFGLTAYYSYQPPPPPGPPPPDEPFRPLDLSGLRALQPASPAPARPRARPANTQMPSPVTRFIAVDIETTGLYPERHEIIEIAALSVDLHAGFGGRFQMLVKPQKRLTKRVIDLTGITQDMLDRDGQSLECAMGGLLTFVGAMPLVFYHAPFDMGFLTRAAAGIDRRIDNPIHDALVLMRATVPGLESYRLVDVAAWMGLDAHGAHRALKDCELAALVYGGCVRGMRQPA